MANRATYNKIFETAQGLGDLSSISDFGKAKARFRNRVIGRLAGRALGGMNVWGLIMWAQFFHFLTRQIRIDAAKPAYFGTFASYAAGWELGFTRGPAKHIPDAPRPYMRPAIRKVTAEMFGGKGVQTPPKGAILRSGLYVGGKFTLDMRSLIKGQVGERAVRRASGAETSRFFWGALMNPDKNVMESYAKLVVRHARKNVDNWDYTHPEKVTGALKNSITWASSMEQLKAKSHAAISNAASGDPRIDRRFGSL